jgi:hypothetical protein
MPSIIPSALEGLAERIRRGEVVFFVGAGFSIDSEGLSAWEIVWRFRLRLEALCGAVGSGDGIWDKFCKTFGGAGLSEAKIAGIAKSRDSSGVTASKMVEQLAAHVTAVSNRYYEFNDWLCDAFGELIMLLAALDEAPDKVLSRILDQEAGWVVGARRANPGSAPRSQRATRRSSGVLHGC